MHCYGYSAAVAVREAKMAPFFMEHEKAQLLQGLYNILRKYLTACHILIKTAPQFLQSR